MKHSKSVLILFAFLCLTFEASAQFNSYQRMSRGQTSQYDSSVNIELKEYRTIRRKLLTADSMRIEAAKARYLYEQSVKASLQADADKKDIIQRQEVTIREKNETIAALEANAKKGTDLARKLQIFPNPIADAGAKVGGGILIGLILSLALK